MRRPMAQVWERMEARGKELETQRAEEWAASAASFARLMALPPAEWQEYVLADERLQTLALADRLLQANQDADPATGQAVAELLFDFLPCLDASRYGAETLMGREASAWFLWADAKRRQGDPAAAERGFGKAAGRLAGHPLDAWERAVYCRGRAVLCRERGADDDALALLQRAAELFRQWGERKAAADVLCEAAELWLRAPDPETAIALFEEAADLLADAPEWPAARIRAWQGVALCQVQLGEQEQAAETLGRAQALYAQLPDGLARLRSVAGEARIAGENDQEIRAISLLRPLIARLLEEGADQDAALAALDLAALLIGLEKTGEIRRLSEQLAPLAESKRFPQLKGSVLRFALRLAARRGQAAAEVLAQVREYLERAGAAPQPWQWDGPTTAELPWEQIENGHRRHLCQEAGLPPVFASLAVDGLSLRDRQLIDWTSHVETGVRILFASPESPA